MSTYNGEKYIEDQIKSILDQTIKEQLILRIRDDGSTDETCRIIENFQQEYPNKIELIKGKNIGFNASFYELINSCSGFDYYSISDQDDVWFLDKLEVAIDKLEREENDLPLLYSSTSCLVNEDLKPIGRTRKQIRSFTFYNTVIQCICPGHTQVFNNSLLKIIKNKLIISSRIYAYDLWIVNYAILYGKIIFNNEYYTYYRQHNSNKFGTSSGKFSKTVLSLKRIKSGDGLKTRQQIRYFLEKNRSELINQGCYEELYRFIRIDSFFSRLKYIINSRLYRQSKFETIAFKLAVLAGKY